MPKLYQKKNLDYYTKSAFSGSIVTYQIADEGVDLLLVNYGLDVGDEFSKDILFELIELGYAFTYGNGAGDIDTYQFKQNNIYTSGSHVKSSIFPSWLFLLLLLLVLWLIFK